MSNFKVVGNDVRIDCAANKDRGFKFLKSGKENRKINKAWTVYLLMYFCWNISNSEESPMHQSPKAKMASSLAQNWSNQM